MGRRWVWMLVGVIAFAVAFVVSRDPAAESPAASASGSAQRSVGTPAADGSSLDAVSRIQVVVRDCGHAPAADAEVELSASGVHLTGRTDAQGRVELDTTTLPPSGAAVISAHRSSHRGAVTVALDADGVAEVGICPGATVFGVVGDGRRPLAGAVVTLGDDATETEDDGEFVLTDVWLDARILTVAHANGTLSQVVSGLVAGEERRVDVTLPGGRSVDGVVVDAGAGVALIKVTAIDAQGVPRAAGFTNNDGYFHLAALPDGILTIRATDNATRFAEVAIAPRGDVSNVVLQLTPQGILVAYWEGAPGTSLEAERGYMPWESPYAPDDPARLQPLASAVEVLVSAPRSWRVEWRRGDAHGPCGEGLLQAGGRLEIRCGAAREAVVSARFVDETDEPITGSWSLSAAGIEPLSGTLDEDGAFTTTVLLDHGIAASLKVEAPGFAQLDRKSIALSPGGARDLGTMTLLASASIAQRFPADRAAPFGGIGARIEATELGIALRAIIRHGPLDALGVMPGDIIVTVDDVPAGMLPTFEAVKLMRGTPGSPVRLRLLRAEQGLFDVEVERGMVGVEAEWLD